MEFTAANSTANTLHFKLALRSFGLHADQHTACVRALEPPVQLDGLQREGSGMAPNGKSLCHAKMQAYDLLRMKVSPEVMA
jgi:hypothetical protein